MGTIPVPTQVVSCQIDVLGAGFVKKGEYSILLGMIGGKGVVLTGETLDLKGRYGMTFLQRDLKIRARTLFGEILDGNGKPVSKWTKCVHAVLLDRSTRYFDEWRKRWLA